MKPCLHAMCVTMCIIGINIQEKSIPTLGNNNFAFILLHFLFVSV